MSASHRVILSGTPIQNSIGELWGLFDWLMPGFLGTEREFQVSRCPMNDNYGVPRRKLVPCRSVKTACWLTVGGGVLQAAHGRALQAARASKRGSREAETALLSLESLHKQVSPGGRRHRVACPPIVQGTPGGGALQCDT